MSSKQGYLVLRILSILAAKSRPGGRSYRRATKQVNVNIKELNCPVFQNSNVWQISV